MKLKKPKTRLLVGTEVKIMRRVDKAKDWKDAWFEYMNRTVGWTGKVDGYNHGGVDVRFANTEEGYDVVWNYPRKALSK